MPRNTDLRQSMLAELRDQHPHEKRRKLSRNVSKHDLFASFTRACREKRYHDAERLLEQYRDRTNGTDQIGLLDLQTDLQIKLGKPDLALENSKRMIRLAKDDPRGYLRASEALQSKSDFRTALKYVNHGIKNTLTTYGSCAKLAARASHLKAMVSSNVVFERAADRIPTLPPELLDMIFAYLNYKECTIILRVSKLWQQTVLSSEVMSNVIDFRQSRRKISREHVRAGFRRTNTHRKKLYFHHLNESAWRYVNIEFGKWYQWSSLEVLDVDSSQLALPSHFFQKVCRLKVLRTTSLLATHDPFQILSECQNLETVFMQCRMGPLVDSTAETERVVRSKLKQLTLTSTTNSDCFCRILAFYSFPNLEYLALLGDSRLQSVPGFDLTICPKLETLVLQAVAADGGWKFPAALRALRFSATYGAPWITENIPSTQIEILELDGMHGIQILRCLISGGLSSDCLRELTLRNFGELSHDFGAWLKHGLEGDSGVFENVETLKLHQENLRDENAELLLRLFPRLRDLEVQSPRITSRFFSDMIRHEHAASRLETIQLKDCEGVDKDLVPWAKARGVTVSIARVGMPEKLPKSDAF